MNLKSIIMAFLIILVISISVSAEMQLGQISFTADASLESGTWKHTETTSEAQVVYFYSSRTSEEKAVIKGLMKGASKEYRTNYYFEYIIPEGMEFPASSLTDFCIETKNVHLSIYKNTKMLMRFYVDDGTYLDVESIVGYNDIHYFDVMASEIDGNVKSIRFWPVYDVYNSSNNSVDFPRMTYAESGGNKSVSEMPIEFRFLNPDLSPNLETVSDTELEYTEVTDAIKKYEGTGFVNGSPKFAVRLIKPSYTVPNVSFTETNGDYTVVVTDPVEGAYYEYSINGSQYVKTTVDAFPEITVNDDIKIRVAEDEKCLASDFVHTTPVAKVIGSSMILDGMIGIKSFIVSPYEYTVKLDGKAASVLKDINGNYVLASIAPKDILNKTIEIEISTHLGVIVNTVDISYMIDAYLEMQDCKSAVIALCDYAKSAEMYFKGSEGEFLSPENDSEITGLSVFEIEGEFSDGIEYVGTSLILEGALEIKHYFKVVDASNVNLKEFVHHSGDYYSLSIKNISILDANKSFDITVGDATITYSVLSYAAQVLQGNETNLKLINVVRALYNYYVKTVEYVEGKRG